MSEDLDSFFAKRKTKASKKKTAIRLDDVAQTMEYNLKFGADEAEISNAGKRESEFVISHEEDSEWIQYDSKPALPLETVGVFNYNEQVEQEYIAEERQQQAEKAKTWQKTAEPEPVKEESPAPIPVPEAPKAQTTNAPKAYKPPNARTGYQASVKRPVHKLDIGNEEMFPSLGMADQLEKEEKVQIQKPRAWATPEVPPTKPQKEQTPEVAVDNKPPEDPVQHQEPTVDVNKPAKYQAPSGDRERRFESDSRGQSDNRPTYTPREYGGGHRDTDRPRPPPQQQIPQGPRGTGVFNARGEEIMDTDRAPTDQGSWRRAAGNTVQETVRQQSPPPADHQLRREPAPPKPEPTNWRTESRPLPPRQHDHGPRHTDHGPPRHSDHRHGTDHGPRHSDHGPSRRHDANPSDNTSWRRDDPKPAVSPQQQQASPQPVPQSQPESPNWRSKDAATPTEPAQNWRSGGDGSAVEGEGWNTVSAGRNRRQGPGSGSSRPSDPPAGGAHRPTPKGGAYVPPGRR